MRTYYSWLVIQIEEFKKQKEQQIKNAEKEILDIKEIKNNKLTSIEENIIDGLNRQIDTFKQELERVETEGFGALKPIYNFYENTVTNILKKQGYNPVIITDEYGNTWNEVSINQVRDLSNVLLQRNEANQIIGQANIKAMTVLIDAINQKQDTLPHEYAHHYIAWFRNTPIVQSIGEQVVKQKGEAYNWWSKFVKWIMNQFNSLSKLQKEELTQILTDAFLTRQILGSKKDIEGFKEFVSGETTKEEAPPFYEMSAEEREERFQDFYNKNQNISEDEAREYFNRCML